jgi:hypothetical protein
MKAKYTFCTLVFALSVISSGCTKLDETVYSEVVSDKFKPTEKDLVSLIAPVYTVLRPMTAGWYGNFDLQEESSDEIVTPARPNGWYDGGSYQRMHWHTWTPTQGQPEALWGNCYNGINTANRVIYQIESGEIPVTTGKESIIAELKAARAYFYYMLCDNHGNVPIVTDFKDVSLPKQSTRAQVYEFVVKELTESIPLLNEVADVSNYGRFNKWAAITVLAKVYLNAQVYKGSPEWAKCIEQCNAVIAAAEGGKYILENEYKTNFTATNQTSKEIIFAVPYDEIFATENQIALKSLDPLMQQVVPMQSQPWGGSCAVPQFIDTYDPDDSRLQDSWYMGPQYDATTKQLLINYTKNVQGVEKTASNEGYRIGKYRVKAGARGGLDNDFPIFRYADILMMKAECLLRMGSADEAARLVTQVRRRAFASNPAKAEVTGADLVKGSSYKYGYWENGAITQLQGGDDVQYGRFLDELGWEFALEAHRRQDLIRFGVYSTKMWFQHKVSAPAKSIFPIPQTEIAKNPNLTQNPSY